MGRLQGLKEAELLEAYLGEFAHEFKLLNPTAATCAVRDEKSEGIHLHLNLENYPGDAASVRLKMEIHANGVRAPITAKLVTLADPGGVQTISSMVSTIIQTFKPPKKE
jgi:hypothetical protein